MVYLVAAAAAALVATAEKQYSYVWVLVAVACTYKHPSLWLCDALSLWKMNRKIHGIAGHSFPYLGVAPCLSNCAAKAVASG